MADEVETVIERQRISTVDKIMLALASLEGKEGSALRTFDEPFDPSMGADVAFLRVSTRKDQTRWRHAAELIAEAFNGDSDG